MKYYIINDKEYEEIPYWLWPNTSPITESFFIEHGGRIEEREDPDPEPEIKHYSKLQILLHAKADLPMITEGLDIKHGDKIFIEALKSLDLYEAWNAADYISTDYDNYEIIVSSIKDKCKDIYVSYWTEKWKSEGYSDEEIEDKSNASIKTFNFLWGKMEENVKKYGEA